MAENSLKKNNNLISDEKPRRSSDGILDDILEEIPEMDSVGRSGWLQIILFPIAALLLITIIPLLLSFTAFRQTNASLSRDFPYESIESELLNNAIEDINAKREELTQKDLTIRRYYAQLENLQNTLDLVHQLVDETLQTRELALQAEIETILIDERARLEAQGYTEGAVERNLERLKSSLDSDYENKMDEFISTEMAVYQERLDEIQSEKGYLEKALETAVEERKALAQTLEESEIEVLTRLHDSRERETTGVDADLEILKEERYAENYWLDELANQYLNLFDALAVRNSDAARSHLSALEDLFSDERIAELPGIAARNEADREIIRFLAAYIATREDSGLEELVTESRMLIGQAEDHAAAGRLQEASLGWQRIGTLWPLMEQAMAGSRETDDRNTAREVRRYTTLAEMSLSTGDSAGAALVWEAGMDRIPDPVGTEVRLWWEKWTNTEEQLKLSRDKEFEAVIISYESSLSRDRAEREELLRDIEAVRSENRRLIAEAESTAEIPDPIVTPPAEPEIQYIENPKTEEELTAAREQIERLELEIKDLEARLAEDSAPITSEREPTAATQWHLYGVVVQIVGDTLIIEPMTNILPSRGEELRIMRSLSEDRVIHLADGIILEANETRAVGALSSGTSGAEVYGSPRVEDLVYITH